MGLSILETYRLDGTIVEVWFPNNPYPHTFKVVVNQMPVSNVGMIQLNMPIGRQGPQGLGAIPGQPGWAQTGF